MSIEFPTIIDDMNQRGIDPFQLYEKHFGQQVRVPSSFLKFRLFDMDTLRLRVLQAIQEDTPIENWGALATELAEANRLKR